MGYEHQSARQQISISRPGWCSKPSDADSGAYQRRASRDEDGAVRAADDVARDASAEAATARAEHDQPRAAQARELDDARPGLPSP
jgi:hypothetical protein